MLLTYANNHNLITITTHTSWLRSFKRRLDQCGPLFARFSTPESKAVATVGSCGGEMCLGALEDALQVLVSRSFPCDTCSGSDTDDLNAEVVGGPASFVVPLRSCV